MLDGEAVVFRPDGHSDFAALRTKRGADAAQLVAFDHLRVDGEDRRKLPLEIRRAELDNLVAGVDAIMLSEAIEAEGAVVYAKARELGVEGIVSERLGDPYWSGRVRNLGEGQELGVPETMIRLNGAGVGRMISACSNGSDAADKPNGWRRPTPRCSSRTMAARPMAKLASESVTWSFRTGQLTRAGPLHIGGASR